MKLKFKLHGRVFNTVDSGDEDGENLVFIPETGVKEDRDVKILNDVYSLFSKNWDLNMSVDNDYDPSSNWAVAMEYVKGLGARILEFEDVEYDDNVVY